MLAQLDSKVTSIIAAGSIGQPVFVRLTAAVQLAAQPANGATTGQREQPVGPSRGASAAQNNTLQQQPARSQLAAADQTSLLASLVEKAGQWLAQPVHAVRAVCPKDSAHLSALVTFVRGAAAMISLTSSVDAGPGLDLTLLGNRGAVYLEQPCDGNWLATQLEPSDSQQARRLRDAIRSSLQTGLAVPVSG